MRNELLRPKYDLPPKVVLVSMLVLTIKIWHTDGGLLPPIPEVEILTNYAASFYYNADAIVL